MITLAELEAQIMALPDGDRAKLASRLLESLPPEFDEADDESYQEVIARRNEMENNPQSIITFEELKKSVGR